MPEESPSHEELVRGCLAGDKRSWDLFVERFAKLVYWSIHKTLETSELRQRQDVVQEVFQEIFSGLLERKKLKNIADRQSLPRFLMVLSCRVAVDKLKEISRFEKSRAPILHEGLGQPQRSPSEQLIRLEQSGLVGQVLRSLKRRERRCIELHYLDGKTHEEISRVIGIPQDTVSSILRRSRQKLKEKFRHRGLAFDS